MQASNIPAKLPIPFATSGDKNAIPNTSLIGVTPGAASFPDGFPPLTSTPITAGGIPPKREDFNGAFYAISAAVRWLQAGGLAKYDSAFSSAVGGYPNGAILLRSDGLGFWLCTADNNTTDPDGGSPANWSSMGSVRSVFGRTGAVTAQSGDYAVAQVTGAAPLASPALTGTPTINGSVALAQANFGGGNQSLTTSGFQKIPGGLILQWASASVGDVTSGAGNTGTITLATTFPNALLVPVVSVLDATASPALSGISTAFTASSISWRVQEWTASSQSATLYAIAVGY